MRYAITALIAAGLACAMPADAQNDDASPLYGSWRLVSFKVQVTGVDAAPRDAFGPTPFGRLIFAPDHRMIAYLSAADRKPPANDGDAAPMLRSMIAYTGTFRVEGDRFITTVDGAWNEVTRGRDLVRMFTVEGDRLSIHVPEQPGGIAPGKTNSSDLVFERER
jgi:hypothetical protein